MLIDGKGSNAPVETNTTVALFLPFLYRFLLVFRSSLSGETGGDGGQLCFTTGGGN